MRIFAVLACFTWHNSNAFIPGYSPSHVSVLHQVKKESFVVLKQQDDDSMPPSQNGGDSSEYDGMPPFENGDESYIPYPNSDPSYVPPYAKDGGPSFMPQQPPPPYSYGGQEYMPEPPFEGDDPSYMSSTQPNGEPSMPQVMRNSDDGRSFQDGFQKQFQGLGGTTSSTQSYEQSRSRSPLKQDISRIPRAGDRPYGSAFSFRGDNERTSSRRYPLGYQGDKRAAEISDRIMQRGFPMQEPFSFRSQQDSGTTRSPRGPPSFNRSPNDDAGGFERELSRNQGAEDRPYDSAPTFRQQDDMSARTGSPMSQRGNQSANLKHDISQFRGHNPLAHGSPSTFREYASPFSFREGSDDSYQMPSNASRKRATNDSTGWTHDNSRVPRASDDPYGTGFAMRGDQAPQSKYPPDRPGQKRMVDSSGLKQDVSKVPRAGDRPYGSAYSFRGDSAGNSSSSMYNPWNQGGKRVIDSSRLKHDVSQFGRRDENPYDESYSFGQDSNMKW